MKRNLLLISKDEQLRHQLQTVLSATEYEVHLSTASDVMQKCFLLSPMYILVDMDALSEQIIQVIQSIQDLDYIPTLYIGDAKNSSDYLKDELIINPKELPYIIEKLLSQGKQFKNQYDIVSLAYETMDALTTDTKGIMTRYLDQTEADHIYLYNEVINSIFKDNPVLRNKPEIIWVMIYSEKGYDNLLYKHNQADDSYKMIYICNVDDTRHFGFDLFAENGFKVNLQEERYSDIDSSSQMFPDVMNHVMEPVKNFAGYGMDQIIVIGCNFDYAVTSYEASILKSATVTLDLLESLQGKIKEVEGAFNYTLDALARAAEASDDSTGHHIRRVNDYAKYIALTLGLDNAFVKEMANSAQMHDVGKIYVDNQILNKKGKLTEEEFKAMENHTIFGEKIVGKSSFLSMAAEIALNHHEKYDGSGYPRGIKGEEIPLSARIVSLADVYDALRSPRSYKPGFTHEMAYDIIINGDGRLEPSHFDPKVWQVFKEHHEVFREIFDRTMPSDVQ